MNAYTPIPIDQPVAAAQALLPLLAEHADEAEQSGQLSAAAFDAISAAGLFQLMFPRRAGGCGHPLITHTETVAEIAKADPGSAWAFGLLSSITASVASMPPVIRDKVFVRGDELEAAWAIFTPLLHRIEEEKIKPEPYAFGSRGPASADKMMEKYYERSKNYMWKGRQYGSLSMEETKADDLRAGL